MWSDPRIWQAVIAGGFVAIGWIVNGWQNRRVERRLRAEKLRDVHRALFAEIGANLVNLGSVADLDARRNLIVARVGAERDFVPFIPREQAERVFSSILGSIHVLPVVTIDAVVAYYGQIERIAALAEDMRSEEFRRLSTDRRIEVYADYIEMKKQSLAFGEFAKAMIAAYALGGNDAARAERHRLTEAALAAASGVSIPPADRSGP